MRMRSFSRSFRQIILIAIMLSGVVNSSAHAFDVDFFQSNEILYYNPDATAPCPSSGLTGVTTPLAGNTNAEKIWNFLIEKGLTAEQAAGVMGNLKQESGYDPNLEESNGIGYGIVQWSFERRTALEAAAERQGVPVSDLGFQLEFMYEEAQSPPLVNFHNLFANFGVSASDNVWEPLKRQTSVERAATFWHDAFERSGDYENYGGIQNRIDYANEAYNTFKDSAPGTGGTATGSSGGCKSSSTFTGGNFIQTVSAYAWPTWHAADYFDKKPEYGAAVQKAMAEGRYVGGGDYPGVDCGGFITTLMIDSGFEPGYNHNGKESQGASNTPVQEAWVQANWKTLGGGNSINVADLQPGDVAFSPGHTFVYVGSIDGFQTNIASASYDPYRAPMAGMESLTDPAVTWYRKG